METAMNELSLGWNSDTVPMGTHACYYYSDEATLRQSLAFLRVGLDTPGEFCVIFADTSRFEQLLGWLQEGYAGDVRSLVDEGKLAVIGGASSLEDLVAKIGGRLDQATAEGHHLIRFLGFIAWGQDGWPDDLTLLEFESRVNDVVTAYPAVIICTYGVPRLSGDQLISGGLETHRVVMKDGRTVANPFYVETGEYVERLGRR
jgi:hypothetical protein